MLSGRPVARFGARATPRAVLAAVFAVAAALLAAGCAEAPPRPSGAAASPSPTASPGLSPAGSPTDGPAPAPTTGAASPSAPAPPAPPSVRTVTVTVRGGRTVDTPAVVDVRSGEPLRLVVTGDATDTVHVHGEDRTAELRPGRPATIELTNRQTGSFEVELEESGLLLFQLRVR